MSAYQSTYHTLDTGKGVRLLDNDTLPGSGHAALSRFDYDVCQTTKHLPPIERTQAIERREKLAREIEQELLSKEKSQSRMWSKYRGEKNWPSSCWKLARNNIADDIIKEERSRVRKMYFLWVLNAVALLWNCVCYLLWFLWPDTDKHNVSLSGGVMPVLLAGLYVCVGVPLSWRLVYKRYYNTYAGKLNNGRLSLRYFANFVIQFLFAALMAVGLDITSAAGFLAMLKCLAHIETLGICLAVGFGLWVLVALGSLWLIRRQHVDYGYQVAGKYIANQQQATRREKVSVN